MEAIRAFRPKLGFEFSCFPSRSFLGKHTNVVPFKVTANAMASGDEENNRKFKKFGHKFINPHVDVSTNLFRECKLSRFPRTSFPHKSAKFVVPLKAATSTLACEHEENNRKFLELGPSEWQHHFLSTHIDLSEVDALEREIEALKPKVRDMFMSLTGSKWLFKKKILFIYLLVSLGLEYHFEDEIKETLKDGFQKIDEMMAGENDLYTISTIFWVFRRYRHNISSDIFKRFKGDNNGEFKECLVRDPKGILSLYEASYIGTTTDNILDEAMSFTKHYLKSLAASGTCEPNLLRRVRYALGLPQHQKMDILVAKEYILFYEQEKDCDKTLLKFAKLNFRSIQLLRLQELKILSKWYKEQDFEAKLPPYFRDRFVELAFASLAYIEPKHSRMRIMLTKIYTIQIILDDTCDRYASLREVESLAEALERWDIHDHAMDGLPDYMKVVLRFIFDTFQEFEKEIGSESGGPYSLEATIEDLKKVMRANLQLARWVRAGHLPSVDEYLGVAGHEIAVYFTVASVLMGMDDNIGKKEAYQWLKSRDKLVRLMTDKARITNDMFGYELDMSRGYVTNSVNCYMNQYGVTKEEAFNGLWRMVDDGDKMMNEEMLKPINVPDEVLKVVIDTLRAINVTYDKEDGFTVPATYLTDRIKAMYVDLV